MLVNNLVVNKKISLPKEKRNQIRASVYQLENLAQQLGQKTSSYRKKYYQVSGQVAELKNFHPHQAERFRERLKLIKPL